MTARILALAAAVFAMLTSFTAVPVAAQNDGTAFDVRSFTCPLGGANFSQDVGYYALPVLTMPDGSWLGDTEIGVQIPDLPGQRAGDLAQPCPRG
ncbi:hypothetical protein G6N82_06565 [Altererythrobacter sp. BO-6]|uniref:hypothetical protein n=1 Tax=Altererythrobacter sp. BO-6 TaxID=2604537 RepID=UPI0013E116B7|nr:hypothetical protein [Altererythrobacter sp. BO-6]QIG53861.1 hypothetical protein G6N82_06565 [Altererythrobacter sp. BO-6]